MYCTEIWTWKKVFDLLDHIFVISTLEKYDFGKNFNSRVKILLRDQESCVPNGNTTAKHFRLRRGTCDGELISSL